jgi:hypothetical protein
MRASGFIQLERRFWQTHPPFLALKAQNNKAALGTDVKKGIKP